MKKNWYLFLVVFLFAFLSSAEASASSRIDTTLTPSTIGQGEVVLFSVPKLSKTKPTVLWMGKKITLLSDNQNKAWTGFIGADLTTKPGRYKLTITFSDSNRPHVITLDVLSRDYGTRRLTLPKKMVELDSDTLKRVRKESKAVKRLFVSSGKSPLWMGKWIRPIPGMIVSPFGCRCIINGMERSPHSGVDLKAAVGDPIKATNSGMVALVAHHFFSGLSIFIDHGGDIQSMYFHLSKGFVKEGQTVEKGAIIGLAGSSGRVTGPHLHFGIRLNNGRIDPIKLIEISRGLER
jgi:murein DD-endopeptidase MepM/ murein hydrolase activator NlpD